jgi:predicted enzyme related to lactoylglutathione lyase
MWRQIIAQLAVADVARAQAYYRDVLGCQIAWSWGNGYGAVFNGDTRIFFSREDKPQPSCLCVFVDDADALCAQYQQRGAEIVEPIESKPWGMREFMLKDRDGNCLRIGRGEKTIDEIPGFTIPV